MSILFTVRPPIGFILRVPWSTSDAPGSPDRRISITTKSTLLLSFLVTDHYSFRIHVCLSDTRSPLFTFKTSNKSRLMNHSNKVHLSSRSRFRTSVSPRVPVYVAESLCTLRLSSPTSPLLRSVHLRPS